MRLVHQTDWALLIRLQNNVNVVSVDSGLSPTTDEAWCVLWYSPPEGGEGLKPCECDRTMFFVLLGPPKAVHTRTMAAGRGGQVWYGRNDRFSSKWATPESGEPSTKSLSPARSVVGTPRSRLSGLGGFP